MARDRAAEAADVVLEEEALDEAAAFLEQDGDVPGKRDRKQEKERAPVEHGARPGAQVAPQPAEGERRRERNEDRDRSLGEHAEADRRVRRIQPGTPPGREMQPCREHRRSDQAIEQRIRRRRAPDDEYAEGSGEHRRGEGGAFRPVVAPREKIREPGPQRRADRGRQPESPLARAEKRDTWANATCRCTRPMRRSALFCDSLLTVG